MLQHGVLAFENLHHDGRRNHEIHQLAEKRARLVDGVEGLRLLARHLDALLRDDAKARFFDDGVDGAGQISRGRVRLDNRKSALNRHGFVLQTSWGEDCGAYNDAGMPRQADLCPASGCRSFSRRACAEITEISSR